MSDGSWLTRRRFLGISGLGVAGMGLYAGEIARHEIEVTQRTIKIRRLPDVFHGMRIVQISDIHFRQYTEGFFLKRVVRRINELKPDAVLITGDFVSMGPIESKPFDIESAHLCGEILKGLECPLRLGVLGNHDQYVDEVKVSRALIESGLPILLNEATAVERDGKRLWITGLRDCLEGHGDLETALPKNARTPDEPVIVMAHEPDFVDTMLKQPASQYADLVLSGHTHAGQIRLPFLPPLKSVLPPLGEKYIEGLFRFGKMQLYVNRGLGATGVPFRLNCPPEITVITLEQGV